MPNKILTTIGQFHVHTDKARKVLVDICNGSKTDHDPAKVEYICANWDKDITLVATSNKTDRLNSDISLYNSNFISPKTIGSIYCQVRSLALTNAIDTPQSNIATTENQVLIHFGHAFLQHLVGIDCTAAYDKGIAAYSQLLAFENDKNIEYKIPKSIFEATFFISNHVKIVNKKED